MLLLLFRSAAGLTCHSTGLYIGHFYGHFLSGRCEQHRYHQHTNISTPHLTSPHQTQLFFGNEITPLIAVPPVLWREGPSVVIVHIGTTQRDHSISLHCILYSVVIALYLQLGK